jgi:hypothetical protein
MFIGQRMAQKQMAQIAKGVQTILYNTWRPPRLGG